MKEPDVIVRAEGLRVSFGPAHDANQVLDGIDLSLRRGEVLALLGPNGAGKTTVVRILTTLLAPAAGRATIDGFDTVRNARQVREIISLTGQSTALDNKQTGRENLTMLGRLAHLPRGSLRARVEELLASFELTTSADRLVGTYSGGMRRRLDLAAGLLNRPRVMFLDEPTTGLDPRSRKALWQVIRSVVAEGTSLFLTTQYLEEADELADQVVVIDRGRVVAEGTPAALKAQIGDASVDLDFADATQTQNVAKAFAAQAHGHRLSVPTDGSVGHVRGVLAAVEATGASPQRWVLRAPTLDDVFLRLTDRHQARTPRQEQTV